MTQIELLNIRPSCLREAAIVYCCKIDEDVEYRHGSDSVIEIGCTDPSPGALITDRLQNNKKANNHRVLGYCEINSRSVPSLTYYEIFSGCDIDSFRKCTKAMTDALIDSLQKKGIASATAGNLAWGVHELESVSLAYFSMVFGSLPLTNGSTGARTKSPKPKHAYVPLVDLIAFSKSDLDIKLFQGYNDRILERMADIRQWILWQEKHRADCLMYVSKAQEGLASIALQYEPIPTVSDGSPMSLEQCSRDIFYMYRRWNKKEALWHWTHAPMPKGVASTYRPLRKSIYYLNHVL